MAEGRGEEAMAVFKVSFFCCASVDVNYGTDLDNDFQGTKPRDQSMKNRTLFPAEGGES